MGEIDVPADRYWGAQTQRSLIHFSIGDDRMPKRVYHAYGYVKKAAALAQRCCRAAAAMEGRCHRARRRRGDWGQDRAVAPLSPTCSAAAISPARYGCGHCVWQKHPTQNVFQDAPKIRLRSEAHGSISVQEGQVPQFYLLKPLKVERIQWKQIGNRYMVAVWSLPFQCPKLPIFRNRYWFRSAIPHALRPILSKQEACLLPSQDLVAPFFWAPFFTRGFHVDDLAFMRDIPNMPNWFVGLVSLASSAAIFFWILPWLEERKKARAKN